MYALYQAVIPLAARPLARLPLVWLLGLTACGSLSYYPDSDGPSPLRGDDDDDDDNDVVDELDCEQSCGDPDCADFCDADGDGEIQLALGGRDCDDDDPDVYPGAEERCDGVDSDCDDIDCNFSDDFESGYLDSPWNSAGAAPWEAFRGAAKSGQWSAASGIITHNQQSRLRIALDFPDGGSISFWHTGSTELDYDFLRFRIDGVERGQGWSGTWGWRREEYSVGPGRHTFEWVYIKDYIVSEGQDAVAVDGVVTEGGVP